MFKSRPAHRVMYEAIHGKIAPGLQIHHSDRGSQGGFNRSSQH